MDDFNLQKRLIDLRKEKGLTQKELAEQINYSDKVISKWERGESLPSILVLKELSKFYNVTTDDILNTPPITQNIEPLPSRLDVVRTVSPSIWVKCSIGIPLIAVLATISFGPAVFAFSLIIFGVLLVVWGLFMSKLEWTTNYCGHSIRITNNNTKLELLIDDQIVDGFYGMFGFHTTLKGKIEGRHLNVKMVNSYKISCNVFIE